MQRQNENSGLKASGSRLRGLRSRVRGKTGELQVMVWTRSQECKTLGWSSAIRGHDSIAAVTRRTLSDADGSE